jgi:hypothetical protein
MAPDTKSLAIRTHYAHAMPMISVRKIQLGWAREFLKLGKNYGEILKTRRDLSNEMSFLVRIPSAAMMDLFPVRPGFFLSTTKRPARHSRNQKVKTDCTTKAPFDLTQAPVTKEDFSRKGAKHALSEVEGGAKEKRIRDGARLLLLGLLETIWRILNLHLTSTRSTKEQ